MSLLRAEVLVGQGTGAATSGVMCLGNCSSLRVHIIGNGTPTGDVVIKQGEVGVSTDLKTIQTVTNPAAGANWITLSPSSWIEITSNLTVGALKKVVVAAVLEDE